MLTGRDELSEIDELRMPGKDRSLPEFGRVNAEFGIARVLSEAGLVISDDRQIWLGGCFRVGWLFRSGIGRKTNVNKK